MQKYKIIILQNIPCEFWINSLFEKSKPIYR